VQAAGVDVNLEIAVPVGLILNELITNAYKHAFPADKTHSGAGGCKIAVTVKNEGGILAMSVADNGVGMPKDMDWEKVATLGLKLTKMLSSQLSGSIELERNHGTTFQLRFAHAAAAG
jgi:two-component sensor histidine kinase